MDRIDIIKLLLCIIMNIILCLIFLKVENNCNDIKPVDYILKEDLDKCYISIHNFVSLNISLNLVAFSNKTNRFDIKFINGSEKQQFNSYISSYTKPHLMELIQN